VYASLLGNSLNPAFSYDIGWLGKAAWYLPFPRLPIGLLLLRFVGLPGAFIDE
jgi:hypothetical protein